MGGAVISLPSVQAQSAVVALDGGNIRAYSTAGTPMWNYSARGRISPFVTRSREGTSYFSRTNGILISLNRAGRELWRRDLGSPLAAHVIVGWDGRLFVPVEKKILCYTASGNLLWTKTFESPYSVAPKADRNGGLMLALENKEVHRIDPFGNTHIWMLYDAPAILLSIENQRVVVLYADGAMEILGAAQDWFMGAQSEVHSAVLPRLPSNPIAAASRGNNFAVTMNDGRIAFVSLDEGKIVWTGNSHIREFTSTGGRPELEAEMFFDERGIYILSKNGASCFSPNGTRLWFTFLQNAAAIPAFGNDGVLYSGGRDWILYSYKIEDRVLPEKNALYGPVPEGNYGMGRPRVNNTLNIPLNENERRARIEQIARGISAGRVGADEPAWKSFLLTVSTGQDHIQLRLGAINLLGKIGSQETIPWLVNIFNNESEPMIRAAAVNAIGEIGVDPQGYAIQTFLYAIIYGHARDGQVLAAIASATGALCRFSGPPLSETGIRILNLIAAGNQPPLARRQATRELSSLR